MTPEPSPTAAHAPPAPTASHVGPQRGEPSPAGTPLPGFGEYEGLELAFSGGMGAVYRGRHRRLHRDEAIKVIRAGVFAGPDAAARFRVEAEAAALLDHPNIVPVYGAGERDGVLYLSMRWMDGGSLSDLVRQGSVPPRRAAALVAKVARAVHHAHCRGVLHRDLKPGNILLDEQGEPHVADFGLAKRLDAAEELTLSGALVGTPHYMAPEQARGARAHTTSVDVFGVGAILYALLTGRPPFCGTSVIDILRQAEECSPAPPDQNGAGADSDLSAICMKCLEKDPARRYPSAADLADDLERYVAGERPHARFPGLWGRALRALLRRQFANVTAWGWINLLTGGVNAAMYFVYAWAIAARQPAGLFLAVGVGQLLATFAVYGLFLRRERLQAGDRHALSVAVPIYLACWLLLIVYRPSDGDDLTAYRYSTFPILALIHGVGFFTLASHGWGGFYLLGLGYFALAVLMRLEPAWSPVELGVYNGGSSALLGWYLIRLGKTPEHSPGQADVWATTVRTRG